MSGRLNVIPEPDNETPTTRVNVAETQKDQRLDKLAVWALTTVAGLALCVGAWFFTGLQHTCEDLRKEVVDLRLTVEGIKSDKAAIEELKAQVKELSSRVVDLERTKR